MMKLDFSSLAFGYKISAGGGTPNWGTSLGQGQGYKIVLQIDDILKGIVYTSVPLSTVNGRFGKGGKLVSGDEDESPILIASVFKNVYINDTLIEGGRYILLITKDAAQSHKGRLRLKYGPQNIYMDGNVKYSNEDFWDKAKSQLKINQDGCFFVYAIDVQNQENLILKTIVVNAHHSEIYQTIQEQHDSWDSYINEISISDVDVPCSGINYKTRDQETQIVSDNLNQNDLIKSRKSRKNKIFPLNFILYGAPGTGKTYSMIDYSLAIIENTSIQDFKKNNTDRDNNINMYHRYISSGRIVFTTFHQNYSYEDFIQGLRPVLEDNNISFRNADGVFKHIADKALSDPDNNYVIIIDEINRANISKVFGELITLIEEDKRWGELNTLSSTLPSGEQFVVPNNLYIIGTMNSADKSISLIDVALRRRFKFIEQLPDENLINDSILKKVFLRINKELVLELKSTDLLIGHSYFMNREEKELSLILNSSIIPLLYEYFYDDKKKIKNIIQSVIDDTDAKIEIVDTSFGRLAVKDIRNDSQSL